MRLARPAPRGRTDNTIALINVVFLMLIFFLFAGSIEPDETRRVTTPEVTRAREQTPTAGALVIDAEGEIRRAGAAVGLEDIGALLAQTDGDVLRIVADRALPAARLSEVLAAVAAAGHGRVALVVRTARETDAAPAGGPR